MPVLPFFQEDMTCLFFCRIIHRMHDLTIRYIFFILESISISIFVCLNIILHYNIIYTIHLELTGLRKYLPYL